MTWSNGIQIRLTSSSVSPQCRATAKDRETTEALVCCTHLGTPVLPEVSRLSTGESQPAGNQSLSAGCAASSSTVSTRTSGSSHSRRTPARASAVPASVTRTGRSSSRQAPSSLRLVSFSVAYVVATATGVGTKPPRTHAQNAVR
ncbi:hypothetical protein STENM327S_01940 [Streptomyces tendae]